MKFTKLFAVAAVATSLTGGAFAMESDAEQLAEHTSVKDALGATAHIAMLGEGASSSTACSGLTSYLTTFMNYAVRDQAAENAFLTHLNANCGTNFTTFQALVEEIEQDDEALAGCNWPELKTALFNDSQFVITTPGVCSAVCNRYACKVGSIQAYCYGGCKKLKKGKWVSSGVTNCAKANIVCN